MGVSAVIRGGFGFLLDRHHDVHVSTNNNINVTPTTNALHSFFRRQREAPLPITPVSILKSMLQLDDLQALLWAWTIVAILLLFAFWSNPNEASFRPFLTDLVFRERLRLLNEDDDATLAEPSSAQHPPARRSDSKPHSSLLATASGSSAPFALTFGSKLALSVRTPPFHRKDLGLLSIVTISQSTPVSTSNPQPTNADAAIDCTSLFIGAFGKWWVLGFAIPDLPGARSRSPHRTNKPDREELEENITDLADWGVLEMRAIDSEPDSHHTLTHSNNIPSAQDPPNNHQPRTTPPIQPPAPVVHPSHPAQKDLVDRDTLDNEDCLSITGLVARSRSEVADLHDQLAQVRSASTRACEALEHDLDQVRSKKKEEERLRSDVKTRTKALDDSKRQVESARREAERRLKAANAARALKQASIQQRKEQIESLKKRRANLIARKATNAEKRQQRSDELAQLISQAKSNTDMLRADIQNLQQELDDAHNLLQLEKLNARHAHEHDFSRDAAPLDMHAPYWSPAMEQSQLDRQDAMYAQLAATPDPLVDTLARMEERSLAANQFPPSLLDAESAISINKLQSARIDGYADLGTSVLRNAFRRANAAAVADGHEPLATAPQGLANPSLQNVSNFEAIKQAFQPTLATEEDGRRSWSAFDVWQSDLRSGGRQRMQWSSGGANASADSLPQFSTSSSFLPLDRSNSAEQGAPSFAGSASPDSSRNLSKVKRAFRWPFRPSQVQDDLV